ncbi:hypothetical protein Dda_5564 [Drechslerella dactyloides]|uniref:Uncharacterized protein n=1 Tax=Drechslerella dactyloides TaxID=74499 RepID=A0AAD6IYJ3_DREDA|nr:hypothetical protein Dda_5564 [Drechslerella dactyloides]
MSDFFFGLGTQFAMPGKKGGLFLFSWLPAVLDIDISLLRSLVSFQTSPIVRPPAGNVTTARHAVEAISGAGKGTAVYFKLTFADTTVAGAG